MRRAVIGSAGLTAPGRVHLRKGAVVFFGASTSPDRVTITKLDKDTIFFRDESGKDRRIERWIGEDLIRRGSSTWLKQYEGAPRFQSPQGNRRAAKIRRVLGIRSSSKKKTEDESAQRRSLSSALRRDK